MWSIIWPKITIILSKKNSISTYTLVSHSVIVEVAGCGKTLVADAALVRFLACKRCEINKNRSLASDGGEKQVKSLILNQTKLTGVNSFVSIE